MPFQKGNQLGKLNIGRQFTEEHRRNIGLAQKGQPSRRLGTKHTKESKEKMRETALLNGNKPPSRKGIKFTEEQKEYLKQNATRFWLGKKRPEISGENCHLWRGGATPLYHQIRHCFEYRLWHSDILRRDDFICHDCNIRGGKLSVDHIKPLALIVQENSIKTFEEAKNCDEIWNINNGRTLCWECHRKTETFGGRTLNLLKTV